MGKQIFDLWGRRFFPYRGTQIWGLRTLDLTNFWSNWKSWKDVGSKDQIKKNRDFSQFWNKTVHFWDSGVSKMYTFGTSSLKKAAEFKAPLGGAVLHLFGQRRGPTPECPKKCVQNFIGQKWQKIVFCHFWTSQIRKKNTVFGYLLFFYSGFGILRNEKRRTVSPNLEFKIIELLVSKEFLNLFFNLETQI